MRLSSTTMPAMAALDKLVRSIKEIQYMRPQVTIRRLSIRRTILRCSSGENSGSMSLCPESTDFEVGACSSSTGSCFSVEVGVSGRTGTFDILRGCDGKACSRTKVKDEADVVPGEDGAGSLIPALLQDC